LPAAHQPAPRQFRLYRHLSLCRDEVRTRNMPHTPMWLPELAVM
jgi:hypothetical protein